jgi:hypothetical protein
MVKIDLLPCLQLVLFQVYIIDVLVLPAFGDLKEEERIWWINKKLEARMHHGRRFWAWELEFPRSHPMWYNRSDKPELFRWGYEGMHDLNAFELVPRPIMANWWCPTPCGTLNLSRKRTHILIDFHHSHHITNISGCKLQILLLCSASLRMDPDSMCAASTSSYQPPLPGPPSMSWQLR